MEPYPFRALWYPASCELYHCIIGQTSLALTTTWCPLYRVPVHRSCSAHNSCIRRDILGQLLCSGTQ